MISVDCLAKIMVYETVSNLPVTLAMPSSLHVYNIVSLIKAVV